MIRTCFYWKQNCEITYFKEMRKGELREIYFHSCIFRRKITDLNEKRHRKFRSYVNDANKKCQHMLTL